MSTPISPRWLDLVDALRDPAAYPHCVGAVEVVETHISAVFLAGSYAYKVKKPVSLGFVDYTRLESRRFYCHEEVRLNRRLAGDVYRGVMPIVERRAHLCIGGAGPVRDFAVWMRRLPADRMMDRLAAAGLVEVHHVEELAGLIARFHASAEPAPPAEGAPAVIAGVVFRNLAQVEPFVGRTLSRTRYRTIVAATRHFLAVGAGLMTDRARQGRVRDGHGDLRPENVCLEERPVVFDCVEFSRRLRAVDVAADIAFMSMELEMAGRFDLARRFVDAYVEASGDSGVRDLLDFYRCSRAVVRGKVVSLRLAQLTANAPEAAGLHRRAEAYFALAERYVAGLVGSPTP